MKQPRKTLKIEQTKLDLEINTLEKEINRLKQSREHILNKQKEFENDILAQKTGDIEEFSQKAAAIKDLLEDLPDPNDIQYLQQKQDQSTIVRNQNASHARAEKLGTLAMGGFNKFTQKNN